MSPHTAAPFLLGALVLATSVMFAGYLILQACTLPVPFLLKHFSACPTAAELQTVQTLDATMASGLGLQRRIFELERELAARQCLKSPPNPTAPLNPEGWANKDLAMLFGCWSLDTTYRTRDVDTGEIRTYSEWQVCFDPLGNGTQTMQSTSGAMCKGALHAEFVGSRLDLIEPSNLTCSDGSFIHRREIQCAAAIDGTASCGTLQPETGGKATVKFERAPT